MENKKYFIGLDIGSTSCGFCVTDENYNLINARGKDLWGVRLFEEAQTSAQRRTKRALRRNLNREKQRLMLLEEIFREEIEKVDKDFFARLKASALWEDDKNSRGVFSRNSLFFENGLTDKAFFEKYKTIYHLRQSLLKSPAEDVRFLFLAIHNMMKLRGNFLLESYSQTGARLTDLFVALQQKISENEEFGFLQLNLTEQTKNEITKLDLELSKNYKNVTKLYLKFKDVFYSGSSNSGALLKAIAGGTVNPKTIFSTKENKFDFENKIDSFGVEDDEFESFLVEVEGISSVASEILFLARQIYNHIIFRRVLGESVYFCDAMVNKYNLHRAQLESFKKVIKEYYPESYNLVFKLPKFSADKNKNDKKDEKKNALPNNYARYIEGFNRHIDDKKISNKCSVEEFYAFVRRVLDTKPQCREIDEVKRIYCAIEDKEFLPKLRTSANSIIPYQVNLNELKKILEVSCKKFKFLEQKDAQGYSNLTKIIEIFKFKIPYFVGPLTKNENCKNAWLKTLSDERIFPWNFNKVVDLNACEAEFIERMKNRCSYFSQESVLPKNSLLYSEYMVLQELNVLKINGAKITPEFKTLLLDYVKQNGTITVSKIKNLAYSYGFVSKDETVVVSGMSDGKFKSNFNVYKNFNNILGGNIEEYRDRVEQIIEFATVSSDKLRFENWLKNNHSDFLSAEQIKRIKGLKLNDWGKFSKKFLDGIVNSEHKTIIELMRTESKELMAIVSEFGFDKIIEGAEEIKDEINYDDVASLYCSPSVKRGICQSVKVVKEIEEIMGCKPEKIFIEVTRRDEEKVKKDSRKDKMIDVYKAIKKDFDDNVEYLKARLANEENLNSERLYLYYQQLGKCMYTNEVIDVNKLFSNDYDVDHIIPQSKIKDDSIDNKVLVKRQANIDKGDKIVSLEIQKQNKKFWENLLKNNLITEEKFNRLTRTTEYQDKDLYGFINRQIVFTDQTAKSVIDLFKMTMPETQVVYSKAKYVTEFRNCEFKFHSLDASDFEFGQQLKDCLIKCRNLNDFHHAKDAFLNIFIGNVMYEKYTKKFYLKQLKNFNIQNVFSYDIPNIFNLDRDLPNVIRVMNSNTPLISFANREKRGMFYKETIWGTQVHQKDFKSLEDIKKYSAQFAGGIDFKKISLKAFNNPLSNTLKYGHLSDYQYAHFSIIKADKKCIIVAIPIIFANAINGKDDLISTIKNLTGLTDFDVVVPKLTPGAILKIGGGYFKLLGNSGSKIVLGNFNQIYLPTELNYVFKNVSKILEKINSKQIEDDNSDKILVKVNRFGECTFLTKNDNYKLFKALVSHACKGIYKFTNIYSTAKSAKNNLEIFKQLSCYNQVVTIGGMLDILNGKGGGNLTKINLSANSGTVTISKNLNGKMPISIINSSVTGIFVKETKIV